MRLIVACTILAVILLTSEPICGQWKRHTIDQSSRGADGVRVADINGDGLEDLVTGWEEGGKIRVYTHPATKDVRQNWPAVTVGNAKSPEDAVFADLDDDGRTDVVSCCEGNTRNVYFHWAGDNEQWTMQPVPALLGKAMWMFAAPMDIDGKNGIDVVCAAKGDGAELGWLESPSNPRQLEGWKWHPLSKVGWVMSIQIEDMDGDGDLDILYSDRKSTTRGIHWLEFNPDSDLKAPWPRHTIGAADREVMFLATGDINHDAQIDIAAAVKDGPITWLQRKSADGKSWDLHEVPLPPGTGSGKGVAIVDVNLDGMNDLFYTCEHSENKIGAGWLQNPKPPGSEDWQPHDISGNKEGVKFDLIQALDIDRDGDVDLVTCEERHNLGVIWYENPER